MFHRIALLSCLFCFLLPLCGCMDEEEMNAEIAKHREAAEQGDAEAQGTIGWTYLMGPGEPEHFEEAVKWFHKAAEQNNPEALQMLASCYYLGIGVPEDATEAIKYLRKAAELGDDVALRTLAGHYYYGIGVPRDEAEAIKWLRKAEEQNNGAATNLLKEIANGSAKKDIESAEKIKEMLKSFADAAEQGLGEVQYQLGKYYCDIKMNQMNAIHEMTHMNSIEGAKWYRKAAELGHAGAQFELGQLYRYGTRGGVPKDAEESVKWFRQAAEQEHAEAQFRLGWCYFKCRGVPLDEATATDWFRKSAEQDYREAQYELGKCYVEGVGVPQDDTEATKWLQKVIEDDDGFDPVQRRAKELLEKIKERQKVAEP